MIKKGQYFVAEGGRVFLSESDAKGIAGGYFEVKAANDYVSGYLDSPITVRRMFELLGCPVPEGWRVIEGSCGISLVNAEGTLFTYEGYGWQAIGTLWFSSQRLDLSDLPVTEEVIRSLPEPLQRKWKELL